MAAQNSEARCNPLDLLDYRRRVTEMYRFIREHSSDPDNAHAHFRWVRDDLFRSHPQSPLDDMQKALFFGLSYYDYDPAFRIVAPVIPDFKADVYEIDLAVDGRFTIQRIGLSPFDAPTGSGRLALFWIAGYGRGLFIPFFPFLRVKS